MATSGVVFEKDTNPLSGRVIDLFEKTRMAYLSARESPKDYSDLWRNVVKQIRGAYDDLDDFAKHLKKILNNELLFNKEVLDPSSDSARQVYEALKRVRYNAEIVKDPFLKAFDDKVLEELLENEGVYAKFIHWAMREDNKTLNPKSYKNLGLEPDEITGGYSGLDLVEKDLTSFIVEHYGDGKDSKRVNSKYAGAKALLEKVFKEEGSDEGWAKLVGIELKKAEKSKTNFIVPNKPMYRIFDIDDINELRGFTGEYLVQEKYDGMRIQIHKIDDKVQIFSYNEKDITDKCSEQVKLMKKKDMPECILDAELMLFDGEEPLHRADTIAHIFKNQYPDATLRIHVFDIMRHEERDLLDTELQDRINILFHHYSPKSHELLAFPSKKDTRIADSIKEVENYGKEIMKIPTAEGVVIKDLTSTYYVGTRKNPKWIKWKKFIDLDMIVLNKKETKSGLNSYTLGAGPLTTEEMREFESVELNKNNYLNVGKALNTKIDVEVGKIIRVKVDEVKKNKKGFSLFSAKVIEIPEVETPEKIITLEMLSKETKKSLKYKIEALEKSYTVTDLIHGEATIILKSDFDGFTIYGFKENNLMAKNAIANLDLIKEQLEIISKEKISVLRVAIKNFLEEKGESSLEEIVDWIQKTPDILELFNDKLEGKTKLLSQFLRNKAEDILYANKKFRANTNILEKDIEKAETPKEFRKGKFKIYHREDGNLNIMFLLNKEQTGWLVDINSVDDIFAYLGKASKYPAEVAPNIDKSKLIDEGDVELGIQRDGYHEYKLNGNKFDTRLHFRVIEVDNKEMWLTWSGYKQEMNEMDSDEGIWDLSEDRYKKLTIPKKD